MTRFLSCLFWTIVFLLIVLAADQLLVRMPASHPTHAAIAVFYRDLRGRLLDLVTAHAPSGSLSVPKQPALPSTAPEPKKTPPASIEAVIEQRQPPKPTASAAPVPDSIEAVIDRDQPPPAAAPVKTKATPARPMPVETAQRYLYADEQGNLHFAATLAEIPERYRSEAKRVGE